MTSGSAVHGLRWSEPERAKQLPLATYVPLLQAAVAAAPHRADLKLQLARTLFRTDRIAELIERFRGALDDANASAELLYHLGRAAAAAGDEELAFAAFTSSSNRGYEPAFGDVADALHKLGRADEALAAAERALERAAADFKALRVAALVLLARGETERLWSLCAQLRARGAYGAYLPSVMSLAASTPEQRNDVAALIDHERWFSATQLTVPTDFAAAELAVPADFNERLAAELLAHKALAALPSTKATTGSGHRIDQLHLFAGPLAAELHARLREAVEAYVAQREVAAADHPMIAHRPVAVELTSWAVVVRRDGHETWHLHPGGWISGAYYVQVPHTNAARDGHPGAIEFGPHPFAGQRHDSPWPRRHMTPQAGTLLLFPSYYGHRTWPTGLDDARICIAFDVSATGG